MGVVVGLVHAIYSSGDWGIAKPGPSRAKRRRVREELGEEVEALLHRYEQTGDIPGCLTLIDSDDPIDRELLLLSLVNRLEDHIDDGMLHQVKRLRRREHYLRYADEITSVVERLEHPCLETAFRYEFERLRAAEPAPGIAAIYETKPGGNAVVALPSYRMRPPCGRCVPRGGDSVFCGAPVNVCAGDSGSAPRMAREPRSCRSSASFERGYVLASTPRSGSTLLARTLMATGVLGKPMEYFNHRILNDFRHQWGVPSPSVVGRLARPYRRLRRRNQSELYFWWKPATIRTFAHLLLARRTTPNGVFANKVTWSQQHSVVVASGIDADTWLRAPRYVFLRRRDHLRQAISWVRARQTQSWSSDKPPSSEHRYDRELIARLVVQIEAEGGRLANVSRWQSSNSRGVVRGLGLRLGGLGRFHLRVSG